MFAVIRHYRFDKKNSAAIDRCDTRGIRSNRPDGQRIPELLLGRYR
jgi:hypothetical protein